MKNIGAMGLAAVLLAGCSSWGYQPPPRAPEPAPAVMPADTTGKWLMVSCYVNASGCRGEAIFDSKEDCVRARKEYDGNYDHRKGADRKAACKPADEE